MTVIENKYDVIVVGAGHAGIEAALASSRMDCKTLMLTLNLDNIGQMSCNPAIGGIGKGHLVKEIDAMGGEMGRAIDATGIQFRMLNTSKGPAVRAARAQADKAQYRHRMKRALENAPNLTLRQGSVEKLLVENGHIKGIESQLGEIYQGDRVILTTGTFLKGLIHVGNKSYSAGRAGDFAAQGLSESLRNLGFKMGRLKTGTCPRLDGRTIDYSQLSVQHGDEFPVPFSNSTPKITQPQIPCHITYTNEKTHNIIRSSLHRSPIYSGSIKSRGPRYCPSIEDKIVRFADKSRHQIFLEPEGSETVEIYPNGLSTSLPLDVQIEMVHSIKGLEQAEIMRSGYAIEYDYVEPTQLHPSLETKIVKGLYHGGQINGTTGYEEAAAQGLMAGINAVLSLRGQKPMILTRDRAYMGVLVDDLVTKGTDSEPYRMFTSRAEYRLLLREDNADLRLTEMSHRIGLATAQSYKQTLEKKNHIQKINQLLETKRLNPSEEINGKLRSMGSAHLNTPTSLAQLLRRPEISFQKLVEFSPAFAEIPPSVKIQVELEAKYTGYIQRQLEGVKRFKKMERTRLPDNLDYGKIDGLSREVREKLTKVRPHSLGQAYRIPGVTPAALSLLSVYLKKKKLA